MRPLMNIKLSTIEPALALLLLALGCHRDEVTHAQVPKPAAESAAPGMMGAMPPAGAGAMPPGPAGAGIEAMPPPGAGGPGLQWQLPKGWTQEQGSGMRFATLKAPVPGKVDVSVVVLPGTAGGELANVNRWRGQIGLAPIDEGALGSARTALKAPAGAVSLYDFTSEGEKKSRMIAGLLFAEGNSWFVKMVGDADAVGLARADFVRLVETLNLAKNN
jgi:hypothetical protein